MARQAEVMGEHWAMNKRLLLLALTHVMLAVGAFALGWRVARGQAGAAAAEKSSADAGPTKPAKLGPAAPGQAALGMEPVPETAPEDPAAFVAWARRFIAPPYDPFTEGPACRLLRAMVHADPPRALQIAMLARQENCQSLFDAFAVEWARSDFASALEWAKSLNPEGTKLAFMDLAMGVTEQNAAEAARSFLPELASGEVRDRALRAILNAWSASEPAACFAWVQSLAMPDIMRMIAPRHLNDDVSAFSELVKASPKAVADFVRELPANEHSLRIMQKTAADLAAIDPVMALAWAGSFESAGARAACITKVLREWVQTDLEAATASALAGTEPGARQWGIKAIVSQALANIGEAEARKWIDSLPADVRLAAEAEAVGWLRGPAAGKHLAELLAGPTASSEDLPRVARRAGSSFAADSPDQAAKWVEGLPSGNVQLEAAAGVVSAWANRDPVATSEWVASLPEGQARDGAAATLAESIAASDPDAAFRWAQSVTNAAARTKALRATIAKWKGIDASSAGRTIEASGLPPGEKAALLDQLGWD
ncbi:MAG: hypothetical protein ACR2OZ_10540 [Verrucomicrobiales bacterium]